MNLDQGVETGVYTWQVPGKPVTIHVDFDVIDSILMEVMQGYSSMPRRGAEVGGILLGSVKVGEQSIVRIVDFEPVPCEHARGPSYLLSESDRVRFEETLEKWRPGRNEKLHAVGMYRSHTRDGLSLTPEDLILFAENFPEPTDVILLVKPFASKPSVGGFFFREEGRIRTEASYLEFPFSRKSLGGTAPPPAIPETPQGQTDEPPAPRNTEPAPEKESRGAAEPEGTAAPAGNSIVEPPRLKRNVWIPLSFIFLLVGVLLGFQAALSLNPRGRAPSGRDPLVLGLTIEKSGEGLHVRWDRQAPAIERATAGALTITDGTFNRLIQIDRHQLRNGSVIYRNLSNRVIFRLEVFSRERTSLVETAIFESVAPVAPAAVPAAPAPR